MSKLTSIQIKAFILLFVFSLNSLISFACLVGIDMGFNSKDHHDEENIAVTHNGSHHHDKADNHHKSKDNKDNCCNDKVINFAKIDKSVPETSYSGISSLSLNAFISSFYIVDVLATFKVTTSIKYFVRSYHPPIPDIRIAIQSFQV